MDNFACAVIVFFTFTTHVPISTSSHLKEEAYAYTVRVSVHHIPIARKVRVEFEGNTWQEDFGSVGADADFYSDRMPPIPKRLTVKWTDDKGVAHVERCNVPDVNIRSYDDLRLTITIEPTGCDVSVKELQ